MKWLMFALAAFIIFTVAVLPYYLGPDDLRACAEPTDRGACQKVDAIVTVSGGDTNARTDEAIKLYKSGWSELLIFSGAAADTSGPSNAEAMMSRAISRGVPANSIIIEEFSRTTAENAQNTAKFVEDRPIEKLILVTSGYHQRRANLEFQSRLGSDITIINHPVKYDNMWSRFWWLRPDELFLAYSELVKIIAFYLKDTV